jgi:transposase
MLAAHIAQYSGYCAKLGHQSDNRQTIRNYPPLLFLIRHRYENGDVDEPIYLRRMSRLKRSWRAGLEQGARDCHTPRYKNRCALLLKHDVMCWTFLSNEAISQSNNEAERKLRCYVLWRKGSYGVWSHRGE